MKLTELLHKPNQLITTKGDLTHNQVKLYDCILSTISPEVEKEKLKYVIHFQTIKEMAGIDDKNDARVRGYIKKLKDFDIEYEDKTKGNWGCFSLLSEYRKDGEFLNIVLPELVVKAISNGDYYTTMDLLVQKSLKGKHSIFLYQYLKKNKFRGDIKIEITKLKEILKVSDKASYNSWTRFNRYVLAPSIKEIITHTDLQFKVIELKTGRTISAIEIVYDRLIEAEVIEEILLCNETQKVIDKILQTDLIHVKGKRVNRQQLEGAIKELNKQHNKSDLILAALKKLVKDNKKTVHPENLKAYLWSIAIGSNMEEAPEKPHKSQSKKSEPVPIKAPDDDSSLKLEKIKVTQEEYEEIYQQHLKDNKIEHTKFIRSSFDKSNSLKYEIINNSDHDDDFNDTPPATSNTNDMTWIDDKGRIVSKFFNSWEEEQEYKNIDLSRDNPKRIKELQNKADKKKKDERDRTLYMKYLKKIELDLILNNDSRLEDFKQNYMRFFQLYEFLSREYFTPDEETLERANKEIDKLKTFFEQFEEKEEPVIDISEISEERLLSKKGKKLFGGALISRLEAIARELKIKIRYKDKIID